MKRSNQIWKYNEAKFPSPDEKHILLALVIAGIVLTLRLADWWFREDHVGNIFLYAILSVIFWWGMLRMIILWINYLHIKRNKTIPAPQGLKVAIFTTSSPGEPLSMFEKTLEACSKISYQHTTYLLDDTRDPRFKEVAEKYGAVWLELVGLPGAKAGKINAALQKTTEDFILVLDPDHIPFPNFFDEVLGFFNDEKTGYVQVSQAYYNQYRSFTAKGAAEQTYSFYGPTQMGMYGTNTCIAIGANCTFRRKALESIGGHGIGLAEDMVTAIRIHAAGWKTIYHPVVVSRGLVPEDFGSFCKQQLKWARGVHEILFDEVPRLFKSLTGWQRISYFTIGTYYLTGTVMMLFLLIPYLYFWFDLLPARMDFFEFLRYWLPVAVIAVSIYLYVQRWMCDTTTERGIHWRGSILKFACWPVFFLGFILSLFNKKIPYIPTAKQAVKGISPFAKPMVFHVFIFLVTLVYVMINRLYYTPESILEMTSERTWGMVGFSSLAFVMAIGGIYAAWESSNLSEDDPWNNVPMELIEGKEIAND